MTSAGIEGQRRGGRRGGYTRAWSQTPEERHELARKAYLAGAFNTIVRRAPDLSAEQIATLRALFASMPVEDDEDP